MRLEITYVIDDEKATYSWKMGKEEQTCTSPIGQDCFFLFVQVLSLLQSSWKNEIDDFKRERLIRKVMKEIKKESQEETKP